MCGLFGGGGSNDVTTKTEFPAWFEDAAKSNIGRAKQIGSQPYQRFQGPRVAGMVGDQNKGFQSVRSNAGAFRPLLDQAQGTLNRAEGTLDQFGRLAGTSAGNYANPFDEYRQGVQGLRGAMTEDFTDADLDGYMNPYMTQALDVAADDIRRSGAIQRAGLERQVGAGAYGGARHGVIEAEQMRGEMDSLSDLYATGRANAFQDAAGRYAQDRASQAAAAGQLAGYGADAYGRALGQVNADRGAALESTGQLASLGDLRSQFGDLRSQLGYRDAAALMDIGRQQQGLNQRSLDTAYSDFLEQRGWPIEMLNLQTSVLSGTPYATATTQSGGGGSTAAQNLGAFGALAGGLGMFGNAFF